MQTFCQLLWCINLNITNWIVSTNDIAWFCQLCLHCVLYSCHTDDWSCLVEFVWQIHNNYIFLSQFTVQRRKWETLALDLLLLLNSIFETHSFSLNHHHNLKIEWRQEKSKTHIIFCAFMRKYLVLP